MKTYMCIDLKSFYASVECVERKLDPLNTNLIVADEERTDKTVCLAITPSLKQYGLGGRARLFEVRKKIREINYARKKNNNFKKFTGSSYIDSELKNNISLELDLIIAKPRMKYYINYSTKIYSIYLKYISKDDIFVYSIDEVFIDATAYLKMYKLSPEELMTKIIKDIYDTTGITATGGIGTNLYLAKVAMDVVAKHAKANSFGVRIASLDELSYRKIMWNHTPITDIWRVGKGIADRLYKYGIKTMGDIALTSEKNEDLLYKLFGINAELLIDHAWGWEPCTIKDIKSYKPSAKSLCQGQVLHKPYTYYETKVIIKEMSDSLAIDLFEKGYVTKQLVLDINYDVCNLNDINIITKYDGDICIDSYGRKVPKNSHGTINLEYYSSSSNILRDNILKLYNKIANPILYIRKINITATNLEQKENIKEVKSSTQLDLFNNYINKKTQEDNIKKTEAKDAQIQKAIVDIRNKYGKNAIVRAMSLEENATALERNKEVGGHHE